MPGPTRREFLTAAGALAASAIPARETIADDPRPASRPAAIPPHRPQGRREGIHAYTDRVTVDAGDIVRFHVSSSYPYELQVCRLGLDVDGPGRDEVVQAFGPSPAAVQPIHPGSYLFIDRPLDPRASLSALTLEVWVRRWRTVGRQAILGQFDEPGACGFGLFVKEDGALSFYLGDGGLFDESHLHTTPPGQLQIEVNPEGLKHFPDNTPSSVASNRWHHVVARFDGDAKSVWVDGREVAAWPVSIAVKPGPAALRIGAAGLKGEASALLDADLAMPAIYGRALSPAEISARFAAKALERPADPRPAGLS